VKTFYILLCATLSLQVGGGIWYLVTFYRTRGQTLEDCLNGTTDSNRIAYCGTLEAYKRVPQGALIASVIVPIILQACMWLNSRIDVCFKLISLNFQTPATLFINTPSALNSRRSRTYAPHEPSSHPQVQCTRPSSPLTRPTH